MKAVSCVAVVLLALCCFSPAFAQSINRIDARAAWMYHADKDKSAGSYEWWYMDAHLENGYLVTVAFQVPTVIAPKYVKYYTDQLMKLPVPPYNPQEYTMVSFVVNNEKGVPVFYATEDVPLDRISMPAEQDMTVKLNNCRLEMKQTGALPVYIAKMDIMDANGNAAKAELVFEPAVPAITAGRGRTFDAVVNGRRLSDDWAILAATARVKADISITGKDTGRTTRISGKGFGYFDKNWGNHFVYDTAKGWIWARIAEADLTIVLSEVPNYYSASYPTYQPCIVVHNGRILAASEALTLVKGAPAKARLPYPLETTVIFNPESGIKGTLKMSGLSLIFEHGPYSRFTGSYALDIESQYGKLKREGKTLLFEYCDFSVK
jgi:hypothetical protein